MTNRIKRTSLVQFCLASDGVGYQPMQLNSTEHDGKKKAPLKLTKLPNIIGGLFIAMGFGDIKKIIDTRPINIAGKHKLKRQP
jgi:hypothetical protein